MNELCIIYNFAQKYREGIFRQLEQTYRCHWCFGQNDTDIRGMELSSLADVQMLRNHKLVGEWYWQSGAIGQLSRHRQILMLGELFCVSTWLMLLLRRLFFRRNRIYLWSHGWYGRETFSKRILKRWFFSMADGVALYGRHAQEVARSQGYHKDNLCVIHNSLDYDHQLTLRRQLEADPTITSPYVQHFGNSDPTLLFVGRLTPVKRLDMLIEAVGRLAHSDHPCNLVLVGDGSEHQRLVDLVNGLGVCDRVWFYGACYDEQENARLIYQADLCVAPGNVGLTAMHAMVYGTPVLTHDNFSYQMPEFEAIRPNQTGAFFRQGDVASLTEAILSWFAVQADNREAVRKACYDEIDRYWTPSFQMSVLKKMFNEG